MNGGDSPKTLGLNKITVNQFQEQQEIYTGHQINKLKASPAFKFNGGLKQAREKIERTNNGILHQANLRRRGTTFMDSNLTRLNNNDSSVDNIEQQLIEMDRQI